MRLHWYRKKGGKNCPHQRQFESLNNNGKTGVTIRLYARHDPDLITFYEVHQFNIVKAVYCCLAAYCKKEVFVIALPPLRDYQQISFKANRYRWTLYLDNKKDAAMIEAIQKIKKGYRNNFLKNLLRIYLSNPVSAIFAMDAQGAGELYDSVQYLRAGKRVADAGRIGSVQHNRKQFKEIGTDTLLDYICGKDLPEEPKRKRKKPSKPVVKEQDGALSEMEQFAKENGLDPKELAKFINAAGKKTETEKADIPEPEAVQDEKPAYTEASVPSTAEAEKTVEEPDPKTVPEEQAPVPSYPAAEAIEEPMVEEPMFPEEEGDDDMDLSDLFSTIVHS